MTGNDRLEWETHVIGPATNSLGLGTEIVAGTDGVEWESTKLDPSGS